MHVHFEYPSNACNDCKILSLSWMGKVPDEVPEDDGWRLNRQNYYQEGWLATGNFHGIVGVTYTSCNSNSHTNIPSRTNYNLRGHRSEVFLVQWNEPYQKLATCDTSGIIFVWIKYEGRWSIELINDRNTPVTDFSWSHDGRMALICYQDGFVLVGSVAGQRYWSSMLNLNQSIVTCGIWTPDDQQVYFGTNCGEVIIMDVHGSLISQVTLNNGSPIKTMSWNSPRFNMEETEDKHFSNNKNLSKEKNYVLLVMFESGSIMLMSCIEDVSPVTIELEMKASIVQWSNSGHLLGIVGGDQLITHLHFYSPQGQLLVRSHLSCQSPVSAFSWGHNDKRVFIATGKHLAVGWVFKTVTSLQNLCRFKVYMLMGNKGAVNSLPLPPKLQLSIQDLYQETVTCYIPDVSKMRDFVSCPPQNNLRLHCTMIRHEDSTNLKGPHGYHYVLYLEYLGGLIPLLKGKRTSKLKPEFVIFNPQLEENEEQSGLIADNNNQVCNFCGSAGYGASDSEDEHPENVKNSHTHGESHESNTADSGLKSGDEIKRFDTFQLPELHQLVLVTSNIWGTKFKILGLAPYLPSNLGQIIYKTSLLHLQPRQMTLCITDLSQDTIATAASIDISNSSLMWSSPPLYYHNKFFIEDDPGDSYNPGIKQSVPIAPMTPKSRTTSSRGYDLTQPFVATNLRVSKDCVTSCLRKRATFESSFLSEGDKDKKCSDDVMKPDSAMPPTLSQGCVQIEIHSNILAIKSANEKQLCNSTSDSPVIGNKVCDPAINLRSTSRSDKLKYIDEDSEDHYSNIYNSSETSPSHHALVNLQGSCKLRSRSVGQLNLVDTLCFSGSGPAEVSSIIINKSKVSEFPRRLVLSKKSNLGQSGKSRSLDSSPGSEQSQMGSNRLNAGSSAMSSPKAVSNLSQAQVSGQICRSVADQIPFKNTIEAMNNPDENTLASPIYSLERNHVFHKSSHSGLLVVNLLEDSSISESDASDNRSPDWKLIPEKNIFKLGLTVRKQLQLSEPRATRSIPSTPTMLKRKLRKSLPQTPIGKSILNSPILTRRLKWLKAFSGDSSDDEMADDEAKFDCDYDASPKSHMRLKLRKGSNKVSSAESSPAHHHHDVKQFILHNKAPLWNENSQVYQLDFGGRVTQESAKNFQIEFCGIQVMQFGRIDNNAYTLDFQYPFSAIQAFAVALANVTQRLK